MFSLVKFEHGEYSVLRSKRVTVKQDKDCIVKATSGAKYFAQLLDISGNNIYALLTFNCDSSLES